MNDSVLDEESRDVTRVARVRRCQNRDAHGIRLPALVLYHRGCATKKPVLMATALLVAGGALVISSAAMFISTLGRPSAVSFLLGVYTSRGQRL